MPDDEWLEIVGGKNWIVITQDRKFHRIENEKLALVQHGVKCFYFPNANDGLWLTLCTFIKFHHKILKSAQESAAPCLFDVKGTGRIVNIPFLDHP